MRSLLANAAGLFRRDERRVEASGLFDQQWYAANNLDAAQFPGGPLRHFMQRGAAESRDPNPFFDARWYCRERPEARKNPLLHYLDRGAAQGLRPSPAFDPAWYLATYVDVAKAGEEPLAHFLRVGKAEGRLPKDADEGRPVELAELVRLKRADARETMALFVTYAPGGLIKPHVRPYLEALAREGVATTVVVAADRLSEADASEIEDVVEGLYLRQNGGHDFAALAHVARNVDLSRARCLFLLNDSVFGPLSAPLFSALIARIRASDAQLIGLSESFERTHHYRSYFLVAKDDGVVALLEFLGAVRSYPTREDVILRYELRLLKYFQDRGLRSEALFASTGGRNETLDRWLEFVNRGSPFVKVAALQRAQRDWRGALDAAGYDHRIAEATLALIEHATGLESDGRGS